MRRGSFAAQLPRHWFLGRTASEYLLIFRLLVLDKLELMKIPIFYNNVALDFFCWVSNEPNIVAHLFGYFVTVFWFLLPPNMHSQTCLPLQTPCRHITRCMASRNWRTCVPPQIYKGHTALLSPDRTDTKPHPLMDPKCIFFCKKWREQSLYRPFCV